MSRPAMTRRPPYPVFSGCSFCIPQRRHTLGNTRPGTLSILVGMTTGEYEIFLSRARQPGSRNYREAEIAMSILFNERKSQALEIFVQYQQLRPRDLGCCRWIFSYKSQLFLPDELAPHGPPEVRTRLPQ